MKKHKHHIIPRHVGGTDDPSNLIELTIADHAEAHKKLYEEYGRWQDRVAWLSLAGIMKDEERIYEILKNSNPGGYKHTEEAKKKLSEMRIGDKNPMYGKPAPNRGIKRPGIGGRKKGTLWSEQERQTQEKVRSTDGYYDFLKDPNRGKKISESQKGRKGAATGKKWYNDGKEEKYSEVPIIGWNVGRLNHDNKSKIGLRWFNNGEINRQFKEGEQPQGFVHGRLSKKL